MIDFYADDLEFIGFRHNEKQQQLIFLDKDIIVSVSLSLKEFEKLYHACIRRAETLDSFEPWKNGWYRLKEV